MIRLEDILKMSWRRLENVLKTYSQDEYIGLDQDVFWRRKAGANIFVLIKTSSEDVFIKTNVCWVTVSLYDFGFNKNFSKNE